jgi:hypothetical protein
MKGLTLPGRRTWFVLDVFTVKRTVLYILA